MRTACKLLSSDGTGFGLLGALAGLPVAVFLCLSVENGWFWLPTIDGGNDSLDCQLSDLRSLRTRSKKWPGD
jgi:hypothetical protein